MCFLGIASGDIILAARQVELLVDEFSVDHLAAIIIVAKHVVHVAVVGAAVTDREDLRPRAGIDSASRLGSLVFHVEQVSVLARASGAASLREVAAGVDQLLW